MNPHSQLPALLAEVDGVILEARSHIQKPGPDTESVLSAAKVLEDMEAVRETVEGLMKGQ